ncbi:hypothetical protein BCR43DRAFT_550892 [Syncephalastrum racemosum]|uniref:NAD(P)-binding domain-containing protein n=1 Tax=Syncephalastrum racemosum TaxID=13706 RepID=A0A1X2H862_SYNRA|nr:hypothetical protein BCR43DRAFT_550892 [Syncephalastrum racemosum]
MSTQIGFSSKQHYVLVTNGDSYAGHSLAYHLAQELYNRPGQLKKHWRVRVICSRRENCRDLEGLNAEVIEMPDVAGPQLDMCMKHVKFMALVPNMTERRLQIAEEMMQAAQKHGIKRILLVSSLAAPYAERQGSPLSEYKRIEELIREKFAYGRWCIFRIPFTQQTLYYWSHMVEERGMLAMPLPSEVALQTVHMHDLCDAVATLILSPRKQENPLKRPSHHDNEEDDGEGEVDIPEQSLKRIYELTSACPYTGRDMARKLAEALGAQEEDIQYAEISCEELKEYLEQAAREEDQPRKSWLARATELVISDSTQPDLIGHPDRPALRPRPRRYLTPVFIEFLMDWFDTAKRVPLDKTTDDLRELTGREPIDLAQFFVDNSKEFHRPHDGDCHM